MFNIITNPIHPQVKFRDYAKAIAETKANMSSDAASAFFSLTQAEYAAGNFKNKVAEGPMTARIRVGAGVDNVAGVKIPVFTLYETGATADNQSLGLVGGGKKIQNVRDKFTNFIEMLIKLASLQTSFVTLDEALKVTNRRVNALENVTIPKIQAVLDYISRELDELEREGEFLSCAIIMCCFGCVILMHLCKCFVTCYSLTDSSLCHPIIQPMQISPG